MSAWGENHDSCGDASPSDCDDCTKEGDSDWRCMAGTGDFRMAMMDSNGGGFVGGDGYGYRNSHFPKYRGWFILFIMAFFFFSLKSCQY